MGNMLRNSQRLLGPCFGRFFCRAAFFLSTFKSTSEIGVWGWAGRVGVFFGPFWGKKHPFWGLFCGQFLDTPFFGKKKTPPKASFWHLNCYFITFFAAPLHKPAAQPLLRSACRSRCCAALTPCRAARRSRRGDAAARSGAATPTTTGDCSGDRCAPGACHLSTAE